MREPRWTIRDRDSGQEITRDIGSYGEDAAAWHGAHPYAIALVQHNAAGNVNRRARLSYGDITMEVQL